MKVPVGPGRKLNVHKMLCTFNLRPVSTGVFDYFGLSIAKTGAFVDIFTYCNLRKSTVFFNPSMSYHMFLVVIFVDNSGVAGGK